MRMRLMFGLASASVLVIAGHAVGRALNSMLIGVIAACIISLVAVAAYSAIGDTFARRR